MFGLVVATALASAPAAPAASVEPAQAVSLQAGGAQPPSQVPKPPTSAARRLDRTLGRFGVIELDRETRTPRVVARLDGFLSGRDDRAARTIVLNYLRQHDDLFQASPQQLAGLRLVRRYRARGRLIHLEFAQTYRGVPVLGSGITANLMSDGRIVNVTGRLDPDIAPGPLDPGLSAEDALRRARAAVGGSTLPPAPATPGPDRPAPTFQDGRKTRLVVMPSERGGRLAYRVLHERSLGALVESLIDARTGAVLRRRDLTSGVTADVFRQYPGAPFGGTQETVDITSHLYEADGPYGLLGPAAFAFADVNGDEEASTAELIHPQGDGNFGYAYVPFPGVSGGNCPPAPAHCSWDHNTPFSWEAGLEQATTQLFFHASTFHDHLEAGPIEFTPEKGNFEEDDGLWATAFTAAAVNGGLPPVPQGEEEGAINNAFFSFAPDGSSPLVAALLFRPHFLNPTFASLNAAHDASLVYHEYTHGLSSRLIVDSDGIQALASHQADSMGEAWSDWYALDYLVDEGLIADTAASGEVAKSRYLGTESGGLRTQAVDCAVGAPPSACPQSVEGTAGSGGYTYGDMGRVIDLPQTHSDGEIWAQTLWDLRRRLIAELGLEDGVWATRLLVTAGMELSPDDPSYLDMRNAILQADTVYFGGALREDIWLVFAARGMGYFASTIDAADARPIESFATPPTGGSGAVSGFVRSDTGTPMPGVRVYVPGHGGPLGGGLSTLTDSQGGYRIDAVAAGTYPRIATGPASGHEGGQSAGVTVPAGGTARVDFRLRRNWAAASGGAIVDSVTSEFAGCEARLILDQSLATGWLTRSPASTAQPGPKAVTVRLPRTVDVRSLVVDPAPGCSTGHTAALGRFEIAVAGANRSFRTVASGAFTKAQQHHLNTVNLSGGILGGVRYVQMRAIGSQSAASGVSGRRFVGMKELRVYGSASPSPPPPPTPAPPSPPPPPQSACAGLAEPAPATLQRANTLRVNRQGLLRLRFRATPGLDAKLVLRSASKLRITPRSRRRIVSFAERSFQVPDSGLVDRRLRLQRKHRALLTRLRRIRASLVVTLGDTCGRQSTASSRPKLAAPPKK